MRKSSKRLNVLATLSLMALLTVTFLLGCSKDTNEVKITPSESNRWLELLSVLPSNDNTIKAAYLSDIPYMSEKMPDGKYAIGHTIPLLERIIPIPGSDSDNELKATLGFSGAGITQTLYAGALPVNYYEAVRGNFKRENIDNAVKTGPMNELLETVPYQGQEFYSWDGDFEIRLQYRSNVRPLGRGHRLALVDDFVFWTLWTDGMKEMIDSYKGNIASLADDEDYRLLAGGLENLDTVTAFFSAESHSISHFNEIFNQEKINELSPEIQERLVTEKDRQARLKPYRALATGAAKDDKGYYLAIALVNPDEATAKDNAKLLEQRINEAKMVWGPDAGQKWSDLADNIVIMSNGRLTLAKLYGPVVEFWDYFEMLGAGPYEPLLMSE